MKYHIGYKVVFGDQGNWYSGQSSKIKYPELVSVKRPKGWGPLAVFKTLEDANSFISSRAIFKCLYTKSQARTWWKVMPSGHTQRDNFSPQGKDYANEVILIERVR